MAEPMATLAYRGRPLALDPDVSMRDYTSGKKALDLTTSQVDSQLNSGFSAYADKSYVDAQKALMDVMVKPNGAKAVVKVARKTVKKARARQMIWNREFSGVITSMP